MADDTVNDIPDIDDAPAAASERDPLDTDLLSAIRLEKDALQDRLLRTAAEFDNYRKRMDRERRELSEFVASDVLAEVLPIVDNLERALQATASTPPADGDAFKKGVELIHKQMVDLLKKRGVTPIQAVGADFDPNVHQAVIHETSSEHREGEVMQELQRGYLIGERLLRPAMVKVAKPQ